MKKIIFMTFSRYIVACSWRKMSRRIDHWSSSSFLHFLGRVNEDLLRSQFRQYCSALPTSTKNDTLLGGLLLGMHGEPNGKKMRIETAPTRVVIMLGDTPVLSEELPHLLRAFAEVVEKKEKKELEEKEGLGVYNEDTCLEFQRLLVAALHAYRTALQVFREAYGNLTDANNAKKKKNGKGKGKGVNDSKTDADKLAELQKKLVETAQLLWQCAFLLWRIAYSQIFVCHLAMLQRGKWLRLPDKNDIGQTALLPACLAGQREVGVVGAGKQGGDMGEDVGEDDEFQRMHEACNNGHSIQSVYCWWIRLQVSHWQALDIYSAYGDEVMTACNYVKIHLIAARHSKAQMEPWETTIEQLAALALTPPDPTKVSTSQTQKQIHPFDAQATVALLKQNIDKYLLLDKNCHAIFHSFRPVENSDGSLSYTPSSYARGHCETLLAALMKHFVDNGEVVDTEDALLLKEHVKVKSCLLNDPISNVLSSI
jgi:hypothetical protein